MSRAPVALFVFRRPDHAARTIAALKANPGFAESPVHVFADGPRSAKDEDAVAQTRQLTKKELPWATFHLAQENRGLARSLSGGVSRLVAEYGRVIVVEDDLLVAPDFISWMNAGLDHYSHAARVLQISGHSFPQDACEKPYFLPFVTTWGWGTWDRAWRNFDQSMPRLDMLANRELRHRFDLLGAYPYSRMARRQKAGELDSWGIAWNWAVFQVDGLVLYPPKSLIANDGFGTDATHTKRGTVAQKICVPAPVASFEFPDDICVHEDAFRIVRQHLLHSRGKVGNFLDLVGDLAWIRKMMAAK